MTVLSPSSGVFGPSDAMSYSGAGDFSGSSGDELVACGCCRSGGVRLCGDGGGEVGGVRVALGGVVIGSKSLVGEDGVGFSIGLGDVAFAGDFAFGVGWTGSGGGVGHVCGDVSIVTRLVGS